MIQVKKIEFAQTFREIRKANNLNQTETAKLIGVGSKQYISNIENNCVPCTFQNLETLVNRLGGEITVTITILEIKNSK